MRGIVLECRGRQSQSNMDVVSYFDDFAMDLNLRYAGILKGGISYGICN